MLLHILVLFFNFEIKTIESSLNYIQQLALKDKAVTEKEYQKYNEYLYPKISALETEGVEYVKYVYKESLAPFLLLKPNMSSDINRVAKEVFEKFNTVIVVDPFSLMLSNGSYTGREGVGYGGVIRVKSPFRLSTLFHEIHHAYLTSLEKSGVPYLRAAYYQRILSEKSIGGYYEFLSFQEASAFLLEVMYFKDVIFASRLKDVLEQIISLEKCLSEFYKSEIIEYEVLNGVRVVTITAGVHRFSVPVGELEPFESVSKDFLVSKLKANIEASKRQLEIVDIIIEELETGNKDIDVMSSQLYEIELESNQGFTGRHIDFHEWVDEIRPLLF